MQVTTTFDIEGYRVEKSLGVVRGIVVRSPTIIQGFLGGVENIIGGRIAAWTEMCEQARRQAFEEMLQHAAERGANAVLGVRYDASAVARRQRQCSSEVICYGTAVVVAPLGLGAATLAP
jgi:uncharacterized protein YbjQ (UPF0145 family)